MTTPDLRPVLQDGIHFWSGLVSDSNRHGYIDADGRDLSRRLDKRESVAAWTDILERAAKADFQGVLWWQPGGCVETFAESAGYRVDSHLIPGDVLPQWKEINRIAHANGLWVGSLLRPAELTLWRESNDEASFPVAEFTADVQRLLRQRIDKLTEYGGGDAFYLDSFGFGECDAAIARWLRQTVGPNVKLFTEAWSDRLGPYTGAYVYSPDGRTWLTYGHQFDVLRWLFPDQPCVAADATWRPIPERVEWGKKNGVAPLCLNFEVPYPERAGLRDMDLPTGEYERVAAHLRRHLTRHEAKYAAVRGVMA